MALGGGTFVTQNKILPGAYINFVSRPRALGALGDRGVVAMMLMLNWGPEDKAFTVEAEDFEKEALSIFGYSYTDPALLYIREVFKGAKSLVLYRPNGSAKATATLDSLTVTALYGGARGNDIEIIIEESIDDEDAFDVTTAIAVEPDV